MYDFCIKNIDHNLLEIKIYRCKGGKKKKKMKQKILMLVFLSVLTLSLVSALPDVIDGQVTIENPDIYSSGWGDITNYVDGDILTNSGELNDVLLEYYLPNYVLSASFDYRVAFDGEGAMEYSVNLDESCLLDSIIIRQNQAVDGSGNFQILTTECFGVDWVEIDSISKANDGNTGKKFNMFYEESLLLNVKFKVTPDLTQEVIAGETYDVPLGIVEDLPSSILSAIISETQNSMTKFLEFMGVRIFESETTDQIIDFEVYAFEVSDPVWLNIQKGQFFEESALAEVKGVTNIWETYEISDGLNSGFAVDSSNGVSVLLVDAEIPTTYHIFSVYSDF